MKILKNLFKLIYLYHYINLTTNLKIKIIVPTPVKTEIFKAAKELEK
jgi:hypothetical protein